MNAIRDDWPLAPFKRRMSAIIIDAVLLITAYKILFKIAYLLKEMSNGALLINLCIFFTYFVDSARTRWSATPGQKLMKLKMVDDRYGRPLTHNRAFARAVVVFIPFIPLVYFYYVVWPGVMLENYEYRNGSGKIWQKMQNGEMLTAEEKTHWHNFMVYVQQPVNEAWMLALQMTAAVLFVSWLVMAVNKRHKSLPDMLCETVVVDSREPSGPVS